MTEKPKSQAADYDPSLEGVARRQVQMLDALSRIESLLVRLVNNTARDGSFIMQLDGELNTSTGKE